jgi:hypothetical protein
MSEESQVLAGILLLSLGTVETGGLYLVRLMSGPGAATAFQVGFARAGHAHAAVLLLLGLAIQPYADAAGLEGFLGWVARAGAPLAIDAKAIRASPIRMLFITLRIRRSPDKRNRYKEGGLACATTIAEPAPLATEACSCHNGRHRIPNDIPSN